MPGISAAVPNQSFPFDFINWFKYGPAEGVDVGVTRQEHAEATLDGSPPQFEAKVGRATPADGVNVGQNASTAAEARMNCLRQLSWLQLGAITELVGVGVEETGLRSDRATATAAIE